MNKIRREYQIKVSKDVKFIDLGKRKSFELIVGEKYYVSHGNNIAEPCILISKNDYDEKTGFYENILIELKDKTRLSKRGDEIGRTPEEAVQYDHR